ncbi:Bromodomain-containing protein 2 [Fasciola hepatica]|uniref:Bromodomain-containing protein 2 n=1 Tax=Fasciola hepatica TaxID=6192 RepID=A0A4E0RBC0_FASHE|nr:Bromodomain-containing protein 2 [Fasciola hepatica]
MDETISLQRMRKCDSRQSTAPVSVFHRFSRRCLKHWIQVRFCRFRFAILISTAGIFCFLFQILPFDFVCRMGSEVNIDPSNSMKLDPHMSKSHPSKITTNQLEYIKKEVVGRLYKEKMVWPFTRPVDHERLNLPVRLLFDRG